MIFLKEYYEDMKDYFNPNIHLFIEEYTHNHDMYFLPPYHGCGLQNRNGTRKLIDYRNGKQCLFPVWSPGIEIPDSLHRPFTRFISHNGKDRIFFKKETLYLIIVLINMVTCWTRLLEIALRDLFK